LPGIRTVIDFLLSRWPPGLNFACASADFPASCDPSAQNKIVYRANASVRFAVGSPNRAFWSLCAVEAAFSLAAPGRYKANAEHFHAARRGGRERLSKTTPPDRNQRVGTFPARLPFQTRHSKCKKDNPKRLHAGRNVRLKAQVRRAFRRVTD
jgi:hypothetical protein